MAYMPGLFIHLVKFVLLFVNLKYIETLHHHKMHNYFIYLYFSQAYVCRQQHNRFTTNNHKTLLQTWESQTFTLKITTIKLLYCVGLQLH